MLKNTVTMFPQFIYLSKHQKGNSTPPLGIHVMFECTLNFRVWKAKVLARWNHWLSLHTRDEGSKSENPEFRTPINWGTPGNLDDLMRGSSDAQSLKGSGREFRNRNCCQPLNHLSETSAHQCFVLQLKPPFFDSFWHVATSQECTQIKSWKAGTNYVFVGNPQGSWVPLCFRSKWYSESRTAFFFGEHWASKDQPKTLSKRRSQRTESCTASPCHLLVSWL